MPKRTLPRIAAVAAGGKPMTLSIEWLGGEKTAVDISSIIGDFRVFEPLRGNRTLFRQVRAGDQGTDVVWPGEMDISADTLWRLAQEQNGATLSAEGFRNWRERSALTLDSAARALGLSRRMVAYYEEGKKPIPRVVALATRALELTSTAP